MWWSYQAEMSFTVYRCARRTTLKKEILPSSWMHSLYCCHTYSRVTSNAHITARFILIVMRERWKRKACPSPWGLFTSWQMIFPTLLSLRLLAVNGRLLGLYFRAVMCLEQADSPHTDPGCVHKRLSVHKHRPRFCPKVEGHLMMLF